MIVAELFKHLSVIDNELDLVAGGADESKAIDALNMALEYCQSVAASLPAALSQRGTSTIQTKANTESTACPFDLLRVDRLWLCDLSPPFLPLYPLTPIHEVGGHMPSLPWPLYYTLSSSGPIAGSPRGYYLDSSFIFWDPIPDQAYQVRAYGLWQIPAFKDRESKLQLADGQELPIQLHIPLASFAVRYMLIGVADAPDEAAKLATETFTPALRTLRKRDRSEPKGRRFLYVHTT